MPCYASTENCSLLLLLINIAQEGAKCLVVTLIKRKILSCRKALYEDLNGARHRAKSPKNITVTDKMRKNLPTTDRENINRQPTSSDVVRMFLPRNKSFFISHLY